MNRSACLFVASALLLVTSLARAGTAVYYVDVQGTDPKSGDFLHVSGSLTFDTTLNDLASFPGLNLFDSRTGHLGSPGLQIFQEVGRNRSWDFDANADGNLYFRVLQPTISQLDNLWFRGIADESAIGSLTYVPLNGGREAVGYDFADPALEFHDTIVVGPALGTDEYLIGTLLPEPATYVMAMTALGLTGGYLRLRKRFKKSTA